MKLAAITAATNRPTASFHTRVWFYRHIQARPASPPPTQLVALQRYALQSCSAYQTCAQVQAALPPADTTPDSDTVVCIDPAVMPVRCCSIFRLSQQKHSHHQGQSP